MSPLLVWLPAHADPGGGSGWDFSNWAPVIHIVDLDWILGSPLSLAFGEISHEWELVVSYINVKRKTHISLLVVHASEKAYFIFKLS